MISFRSLHEDELDAWYDHCQGVFVREKPGYFRRHYENDPDRDCSLIFVAVDDDLIVSTVRLFKRKCWIHGNAVEIGAIGEVSTKPAYRRKGLVKALLGMSIDAMMRLKMPISMLLGDQPIYHGMGWHPVMASITSADVSEFAPLPEGISIQPWNEQALPILEGIYSLIAGRLNGAFLRSSAYWRQWVVPQWPSQPALLYEAAKLVGYCSATKAKEEATLMLHEFCVAPQSSHLIAGFLKAMAQEQGCHLVSTYSALLPGIPGAVSKESRYMMVRINEPWGEYTDSSALAGAMEPDSGLFTVDMF